MSEIHGAPWSTSLLSNHPLVGTIYSPPKTAFVSMQELTSSMRNARFVLLGEKHDNPDHHRLQAFLLGAWIENRRRPAVAMEMLTTKDQPVIDQFLAHHPGDTDGLAVAVGWEQSGWPDYTMYRPIVARALSAQLPLVAANLPQDEARQLVRQPPPSSPDLPPLSPSLMASLEKELEQSHCGHLPASMVPGMSLAQRTRDATMARKLLETGKEDGAVLIAGNGHVRNDRGVPFALRHSMADASVLSIGLLEVQKEWQEPEKYAEGFGAEKLPFDYVWFTPRMDDADPCEAFRKRSAR